MPSVVTFWQMPSEEEKFFRYLARFDARAIRHPEDVADPEKIRAVPIKSLIGRKDAERVYLTLPSMLEKPLSLQKWNQDKPGESVRYTISYSFPAIIYDAGTLEENRLSQSNVSCDLSQSLSEVVVWMRRVLGWLRRATPHWCEFEGCRVTELAMQASIGGMSLVPYHGWSGNSTGRSSFGL
jgi:hypothetical protein